MKESCCHDCEGVGLVVLPTEAGTGEDPGLPRHGPGASGSRPPAPMRGVHSGVRTRARLAVDQNKASTSTQTHTTQRARRASASHTRVRARVTGTRESYRQRGEPRQTHGCRGERGLTRGLWSPRASAPPAFWPSVETISNFIAFNFL